MTQNFPAKIARLEAELATLRAELSGANETQQAQLRAREISILRSLRWYTARLQAPVVRPERRVASRRVAEASW